MSPVRDSVGPNMLVLHSFGKQHCKVQKGPGFGDTVHKLALIFICYSNVHYFFKVRNDTYFFIFKNLLYLCSFSYMCSGTGKSRQSGTSGGGTGPPSRRSTALITASLSSSQSLPLTTVPTLKTPFDGVKIAPWAKPEEGLGTVHTF